jgi:hypothetical protein
MSATSGIPPSRAGPDPAQLGEDGTGRPDATCADHETRSTAPVQCRRSHYSSDACRSAPFAAEIRSEVHRRRARRSAGRARRLAEAVTLVSTSGRQGPMMGASTEAQSRRSAGTI